MHFFEIDSHTGAHLTPLKKWQQQQDQEVQVYQKELQSQDEQQKQREQEQHFLLRKGWQAQQHFWLPGQEGWSCHC